jgi:CheY-like chemotaxis protein
MSESPENPRPGGSQEAAAAAIAIVPKLLWIVFAAVALALFYHPLRDQLLPKLSTLKVGSLEASFVAVKLQEIGADSCRRGDTLRTQIVNDRRRLLLARRARTLAPALEGAKVLWVDDHPDWNRCEREILTGLGMEVDTATSNPDALAALRMRGYDLVISDVGREREGPGTGLRLLDSARLGRFDPVPFIFYTGSYDETGPGTPEGAYAVAHRPDYLIHFVFDALERGGAPYPAGTQRLATAATASPSAPSTPAAAQPSGNSGASASPARSPSRPSRPGVRPKPPRPAPTASANPDSQVHDLRRPPPSTTTGVRRDSLAVARDTSRINSANRYRNLQHGDSTRRGLPPDSTRRGPPD